MAIAITRQHESAAELRRLARGSRDVAQARRLLAIALVMEGRSRTDAATAAGMDRQSLRDWVHRFNADGPAGLLNKPRSGRPPRLSEEQLRAFAAVVEAGPDFEADGVVRWRCADLQRVIAEKYSVALSERSIGRILNERGFRHVSVRPKHPKSDAGAQDLFKTASPTR